MNLLNATWVSMVKMLKLCFFLGDRMREVLAVQRDIESDLLAGRVLLGKPGAGGTGCAPHEWQIN